MRDLLKLALESKGCKASCISNGLEALNHLKSLEQPSDVILLDMRMPIMGGREFLERSSEVFARLGMTLRFLEVTLGFSGKGDKIL